MAVLHYTYLVLKMPTEQGVLSLRANHNVTYSCENESFTLTEATDISIPMQDYLMILQQISLEYMEIPTMEAARASTKSKEVKEVVLTPATSLRLPGLEPTSIPIRKTCSSAS
jgi:hypothetical protein